MPVAAKVGVTTVETPTDREVVVTRAFDAPRRLLWECLTNPAHLPNWMLGPPGWAMVVCENDLRPGGKWRYVWRKPDGTEMTLHGINREVVPQQRIIATESWGPEWPETINTFELLEENGQTTVVITLLYPSKDARDAALKTGMKEGMDQSYARLEALLRTLA
jgi:uncharacterized protein YndB with AHSA1/START domain